MDGEPNTEQSEETMAPQRKTILGQQPEEFLEQIQKQTRYSSLRDLLVSAECFLIIALVLYALVAIVIALDSDKSMGGPTVFILAKCGFGILFTIIIKRLATVLIDISDTLIEQNRKK